MLKKIKITRQDMLSFLKVSNLILFASTLMLCLTVILFKQHHWNNVEGASILLWVSSMLLIVSGTYYYYFEFQYSKENWLNFGGDEEEDMVDEGAYAEDEVEEVVKKSAPPSDIPLHITNHKETDIYILLDEVRLSIIRHRIGRGASEIIRFSTSKEAEEYASNNLHLWQVVKVRFEDEHYQHTANNKELLK